jgi:TPR repeat protein
MSALESVMRRVFLGLLIGLVLFPAASRAQEAPAHACDLAAASPYDSMRPSEIPGISFEKIDAKVALPACQAALATDPENPRLLYEMGRAYEANKDDTQARTFYEKAAARGNPGAQHNLSNFYARGLGGLPKSYEEAVRLLKLAAGQGFGMSQYGLATFYDNGLGGVPKNEEEAVRLFKLAADQGIASAQYALGTSYAYGQRGLPQDDREAARLFKLAADQDNASAQYVLGAFYAAGRGGLPNSDEDAVRLFKLAADQGLAIAQFSLGNAYAAGQLGLTRDDREAARLLKLAADQGYPQAEYLKLAPTQGLSPSQDLMYDARRLKLGADKGNAEAEYLLGALYETGLGTVPRNSQEAVRLYRLAAKQGLADARAALIRISRNRMAVIPKYARRP